MKGIIFTIGLFLLVLTVFGFSLVLFHSNMQVKNSVAVLAVFDRMDNEATYTGNIFYDMLSDYDVYINVEGGEVTITEDFPASPNEIFSEIDKLAEFLENKSDFILYINNTKIKNEFGYVIKPADIIVSHDEGLGGDVISVFNASKVSGYTVSLSSLSGEITVNWPDNPGSERLTLTIQAETGFSQTKYMDFSSLTEIDITVGASSFDLDVGSDTDPGRLTIDNQNSASSRLGLTIETESGQTVNFPEETFNIESMHMIKKRGSIELG